jgi:hypothetical protein
MVSLESLVLRFHGAPPLWVGKRTTDSRRYRRKSRRRGRRENQAIRRPKDTGRAPGDHRVDVSRMVQKAPVPHGAVRETWGSRKAIEGTPRPHVVVRWKAVQRTPRPHVAVRGWATQAGPCDAT